MFQKEIPNIKSKTNKKANLQQIGGNHMERN